MSVTSQSLCLVGESSVSLSLNAAAVVAVGGGGKIRGEGSGADEQRERFVHGLDQISALCDDERNDGTPHFASAKLRNKEEEDKHCGKKQLAATARRHGTVPIRETHAKNNNTGTITIIIIIFLMNLKKKKRSRVMSSSPRVTSHQRLVIVVVVVR